MCYRISHDFKIMRFGVVGIKTFFQLKKIRPYIIFLNLSNNNNKGKKNKKFKFVKSFLNK